LDYLAACAGADEPGAGDGSGTADGDRDQGGDRDEPVDQAGPLDIPYGLADLGTMVATRVARLPQNALRCDDMTA
jgi:hypothetical protein